MSSDKVTGEVAFDALGKNWRLKYSIRAVVEQEQRTRQTQGSLEAAINEGGMYALSQALLTGLLARHKKVNIDQVYDIIDEIGFSKALFLYSKGLKAAGIYRRPEDEKEDRDSEDSEESKKKD